MSDPLKNLFLLRALRHLTLLHYAVVMLNLTFCAYLGNLLLWQRCENWLASCLTGDATIYVS